MSIASTRSVICMNVVLVTLFVPCHAFTQDPASKASTALSEMDGWLSQDPQAAAGWHAALQTERLRAQLARGTDADLRCRQSSRGHGFRM